MSSPPLETRLAQWGALAGGLAHEIKNPLSTMNITLQLLAEDLREKPQVPSGPVLRRIEMLLAEVQRLEGTLNSFLKLAREPELDLRDRDPNRLIEELLSFFEPELEGRGISVQAHLDHSVRSMRVDPDLLRQALTNLVRNAMEAMPGGGTLTIQVLAEGADRVRIITIDTGPGIEADILDRIFDGFFSTKKGGTGIGLALVRQIIQLHDGSIEVESAPGLGSRFVIDLPLVGPTGERDGEAR